MFQTKLEADSFNPLVDNIHSRFSFVAGTVLFVVLGGYQGIKGENPFATNALITAKFLILCAIPHFTQMLFVYGRDNFVRRIQANKLEKNDIRSTH